MTFESEWPILPVEYLWERTRYTYLPIECWIIISYLESFAWNPLIFRTAVVSNFTWSTFALYSMDVHAGKQLQFLMNLFPKMLLENYILPSIQMLYFSFIMMFFFQTTRSKVVDFWAAFFNYVSPLEISWVNSKKMSLEYFSNFYSSKWFYCIP